MRQVEGMLPPAVDEDPYGNHKIPDETVLKELDYLIHDLKNAYGIKPVIYTTKELYELMHGEFPEYDIWIRSVYKAPPEGMAWRFWQYSNRKRLSGFRVEKV